MSDSTRKSVPAVEEIARKATESIVDKTAEKAAEQGAEAAMETVELAKWEYDLLRSQAERSSLDIIKASVRANTKRLALGGATVLTLAAAAVVVAKRETILDRTERATEVVADKTEHGAREVKKTAKSAQTDTANTK